MNEISNILTDGFFTSVWRLKPNHLSGVAQNIVDRLCFLDDLDELVVGARGDGCDFIRILKEGRPLPPSQYMISGGAIDLRAVKAAFYDGFSIVLNRLHETRSKYAMLAREIEIALYRADVIAGRPVGINMYISSTQAQALPIHEDDHDVLIIQLQGKKRWRVFSRPSDTSNDAVNCTHLPHGAETDPLDCTLHFGDVLYVPSGFPHDALAIDGTSIHLTIAIYPLRLGDICVAADLGPVDPDALVPLLKPQAVRDVISDTAKTSDLRAFASMRSFNLAIQACKAGYVERLTSPPSDLLASAIKPKHVTSNSLLGRKTDVVLHFEIGVKEVILRFPGSVMRGDPDLTEAFKYIADHELVCVSLIPGLSIKEAVELCEILLDKGLLSLCSVGKKLR